MVKNILISIVMIAFITCCSKTKDAGFESSEKGYRLDTIDLVSPNAENSTNENESYSGEEETTVIEEYAPEVSIDIVQEEGDI